MNHTTDGSGAVDDNTTTPENVQQNDNSERLREALRRHVMDWGTCDNPGVCGCSHAAAKRLLLSRSLTEYLANTGRSRLMAGSDRQAMIEHIEGGHRPGFCDECDA